MPEGPEIRRAADRLAEAVVGRPLASAWFHFPALKRYQKALVGHVITGIVPHGKALLTHFDHGLSLYSHNQLYGVWKVAAAGERPDEGARSLRVALETDERAILLYSASDVAMWKTDELLADLHVINRGFGGSEMIDTLHFADRIVIPCQPKVMLIYAGSNDLGHNESPCAIAARFKQLIARVHAGSPQTEIVFMSIKPTLKRWALIHRIRATNALIEAVCVDHEHVHYLDAHTPMLNADGEPEAKWLSTDGLHLNSEGYQHLTEVVRPVIDKLLAVEAAE